MPIEVDFRTGRIAGRGVVESSRTIADLKNVFADETARQSLKQNKIVYRVQCFFPVSETIEGGLFWGNTLIEPGMIGDEYFMTKGHFHARRNRGEYYVTVAGEGALILMDEARRTRFEAMRPGTVHYIPGYTAHRVANTGAQVLSFLACWPSDAGHDYETIAANGFGARLRNIGGTPTLVEERDER